MAKCEAVKERNLLFEYLRRKGNHIRNTNIKKKGSGEIVVEKSPTTDVSPDDYLICEFHLGYYYKRDLRRHMRECTLKPNTVTVKDRVQGKASMLSYHDPVASEALKDVTIEFYRLPEDTLQLAKCGKLLLIMEQGAGQYAGKSLEEINLDINGKIYSVKFGKIFYLEIIYLCLIGEPMTAKKF